MLTHDQRRDLNLVLTLVVEAEKYPAENTEVRLVQRSGLPEETVAWALDVLCLEGKGWLDFVEHPRSLIRAYKPNDRYRRAPVEHRDTLLSGLYSRWSKHPSTAANVPRFDGDPEDPDDEWSHGVYED